MSETKYDPETGIYSSTGCCTPQSTFTIVREFSPSPSPVVVEVPTFTGRITVNVTDEMVEAAMVKWRGSQWGRHPFLSQTETEAKDFEAMRAALVAALRVR